MKTLVEEFKKFDEAHADIWELFVKLTFELINANNKHGSADAVLHRIRWEYATSTQGQAPKINNNFSAMYSRKFADKFPQYASFFSRRRSCADTPKVIEKKSWWMEGKLFPDSPQMEVSHA